MHAVTLRGIDDKTYDTVKKFSRNAHTSINKFIINLLREKTGVPSGKVNHDFDEFFGGWDSKQAREFLKSTRSLRKIDREMWD